MSISKEHYLLAMSIPRDTGDVVSVSEYISKYGSRTNFFHIDDLKGTAGLTVEGKKIFEATKNLLSVKVPMELMSPSDLRFSGGLEFNSAGVTPSSILTPTPSIVPSSGALGLLERIMGAL